MTSPLESGATMPAIHAKDLEGNETDIVASVAGNWAVVQFYRGDWWPYCRQQLVDFAAHAGPFKDADIKLVFASVDSVETTADLKQALRVGFPMYAEVDAAAVAESTGAFMQSGERTFLHATGFLLSPKGRIASAVYSTGPAGRLTPGEILRVVSFAKNR